MRFKKKIMIALTFLFFFSSYSLGEDMRGAYRKAFNENKSAQESLNKRIQFINKSKKELLALIKAEKNKVDKLERAITKIEKNTEKVNLELEELLKKNSKNSKERYNLTLNIRSSAEDLKGIIDSSMITPGFPERNEVIDKVLNLKRFPGFEDIRSIFDLYFQEMKLSGEVNVTEGSYINRFGEKEKGQILRIGKFSSFYRNNKGETDFLVYSPKMKELCALSKESPYSIRNNIQDYLDGKSDDVFMDISKGAALKQISEKRSLIEQIKAGGLLIYPILILGFTAVLFGIERIFAVKRLFFNSDELMEDIKESLKDGENDLISVLPQNINKPVLRVLKSGIEADTEDRETLETVLQEAILKEIPPIEKKLSLLSVTGSVAPLLGLLGTVTGMIKTFNSITLYGTGDPRLMSGGISEALVTTMLGLAVAIPVMLIHTYLNQKADNLISDMEEKAVSISNIILMEKENTQKKEAA